MTVKELKENLDYYDDDGRQDISGIYDNWEDAIARIRSLYNMDKNIPGADKQYYYFAKER